MAKRRSIVIAFICAAFLIGLNIPVPTRQGVNYKVRVYKIPLYIKMIEFISRDYRYAQLSGEITSGKGSEGKGDGYSGMGQGQYQDRFSK